MQSRCRLHREYRPRQWEGGPPLRPDLWPQPAPSAGDCLRPLRVNSRVEDPTRPGLGKRLGLEAEPSAPGIRGTQPARRSGVPALCAVRPGSCGFPDSGAAPLGFLASRD